MNFSALVKTLARIIPVLVVIAIHNSLCELACWLNDDYF
jgi:hypothetical protein